MIDWNLVNGWDIAIFGGIALLIFIFPKTLKILLPIFRPMKNILIPEIKESLPDWSQSPDWATYVAQDITGEWRWHNRKPKLDENGFWIGSTAPESITRAGFTFTIGDEYKTSLTKRPKVA